MSIALGVFDLFTGVATGSTYIAWLAYVLYRLGWWPTEELRDANSTLLFGGLLVGSYLVGHMIYRLGEFQDRLIPGQSSRHERAARQFVARNPDARARELTEFDPALLLAGVEIHARETSQEVNRLQAVGLTMRNSAPAMVLAAGVSIVEIFASARPLLAAVSGALFLAGGWALTRRGRQLRDWAVLKTLELAYWLPEVGHDASVNGRG